MTGDELLAVIVRKHFPTIANFVPAPLSAATLNNALRLELSELLGRPNQSWADILERTAQRERCLRPLEK